MIHLIASLALLFHIFKKCPRCGEVQRFEGKKKGDAVVCKRCGHKFVLK